MRSKSVNDTIELKLHALYTLFEQGVKLYLFEADAIVRGDRRKYVKQRNWAVPRTAAWHEEEEFGGMTAVVVMPRANNVQLFNCHSGRTAQFFF